MCVSCTDGRQMAWLVGLRLPAGGPAQGRAGAPQGRRSEHSDPEPARRPAAGPQAPLLTL